MTETEFAEKILALPADAEEEFFKKLKDYFTESEIKSIREFVGIHGLFRNPLKYYAVQEAMLDAFCEQFFGCAAERRVTRTEYAYSDVSTIVDVPILYKRRGAR